MQREKGEKNRGEKGEKTEEEDIDNLIALFNNDTALEKTGFKKVLQALKDGTWDIDDAFDTTTGTKREKIYRWDERSRPVDWRTFVINVAEGGVNGDHIPYFEYAKRKGARFDEIDKYGRNILHLLFDFCIDEATVNDLKWLFNNLDDGVIKSIINAKKRDATWGEDTQIQPLDCLLHWEDEYEDPKYKAPIIALLESKGAKSGKTIP